MSNHQTMSEKSPKKNLGAESDIVNLILEDHKPFKRLIKIMKDSDKHSLAERSEAFGEFAPLLVVHAKPEEQVLYTYMKADEDLREGGFEGDVEHQLADQLVEEIMRADDEDLWSARVKVLAELVEHHIEEEEKDLLPDFKKESEPSERRALGQKFLLFKTQLLEQGGTETPYESRILPRSEGQY